MTKKSLTQLLGMAIVITLITGCSTTPRGTISDTEAAAIAKYMARQESNRGR